MQHDPSYKLLFSHPAMVEDPLRGFVHKEWFAQVDFSTLEIERGDFVRDQRVKNGNIGTVPVTAGGADRIQNWSQV